MKGKKGIKNTETAKLLFALSSLGELIQDAISAGEVRESVRSSLYRIMGAMPTSRGAVFTLEENGILAPIASKGITAHLRTDIRLDPSFIAKLSKVKNTIIGGRKGQPIFIWAKESGLIEDGGEILIPLQAKGRLIGLLLVGRKFGGERYTKRDLELLTAMAHSLAVNLYNYRLFQELVRTNEELRKKIEENRRLYENLESIYHDTIKALAAAIDAKDPWTKGHSDRVARISVAIAREMNLPEEDVRAIHIASHLHDIGKIVTETNILTKKGKLTPEEYEEIKRHPVTSYEILSKISFPYPDVALLTRHHHEWVNGSGYPDGLKREDLPLGSRIIAVADAFDAMISDRPYRSALPFEKTLRNFLDYARRQFDPEISAVLMRILKKELNGEIPSPDIVPLLKDNFDPCYILDFLDKIIETLLNN